MRLINADELKKAMLQEADRWGNLDVWIAHNVIDNAPTVEPKKGEWLDGYCSECNYIMASDTRREWLSEVEQHYCYNCGAKMDSD